MDNNYCVLRQHLDELGYKQHLNIDSVPLVERLLSDLVKTTESLYHYKNVAQSAIEDRDQFQLGAEPYKCDNAKLVKECNDLHLAFIQYKEQTDKSHKDLKHQIHRLEKENEQLKKSTGKSTKKGAVSSKAKQTADIESAMSLAEQRTSDMMREVKKLKTDLLKHTEMCDCLKTKLNSRDKEIQRLNGLLEGGRPLTALNKDCCYKDMNARMNQLTEENGRVMKDKSEMETQLAEAISKQHEAMKRALYLADRNKELERELRDIDQMALAVEAECNSTVKQNVNRVTKYQEQLDNCAIKIQNLEREITDLKRAKLNLETDLTLAREEKQNLHQILDATLEDKKKMTDRINQFTRIEHDLNVEIDRLVQTSTLQKRKIAELECQIIADNNMKHKLDTGTETDFTTKNCKCCKKCRKPKLDETLDDREQNNNVLIIEKLKQECKTLREELASVHRQDDISSLNRKLCEKVESIKRLEKENRDLMREKHELLAQIESARELKQFEGETGYSSIKSTLSRVEKERDIARADIKRLEDERNTIRKRLKADTETHIIERDRLQQVVNVREEKLRQLEMDRREMMTVQGSRRATINNLEEQIESFTTQLRATQSELEHMNTLYSQIKTLQEQTDRALADVQGQLTQVEMEYAHSQERVRELERDRSDLDKEVSILKNDLCIMKGNVAKIDLERDHLLIEVDNKTERIAALEQELSANKDKVINMEMNITELKQQLSLNSDNTTSKDYMLKNINVELVALKREIEQVNNDKSNALDENRRLQDELAKMNLDWRNVNSEVERAMRENEDLKTQLQQYVFEIRRAEELISKKESEREDMLNQFHSLSHEANLLENSNHNLETKAIETETQFNEALNHIAVLETKIDQQDLMNQGYEKQISELTSQIAYLEIQVKQHTSTINKTETELSAMKDLCVKLDEQKDALKRELNEKNIYKSHLEGEKDRLKVEMDRLKDSLDKEQSNIDSLEHLLATSRQETVEQQLIRQELQNEVHRLKNLVEDLQQKLLAIKKNEIGIQLKTIPPPNYNDDQICSHSIVCEVTECRCNKSSPRYQRKQPPLSLIEATEKNSKPNCCWKCNCKCKNT